jgi:hypothetical protein
VLEDAGRLIAVWNERQAKRMPMLFSPTIGAAITAGYWFLWVRCPACRTTNAINLRTLDRHRDAVLMLSLNGISYWFATNKPATGKKKATKVGGLIYSRQAENYRALFANDAGS